MNAKSIYDATTPAPRKPFRLDRDWTEDGYIQAHKIVGLWRDKANPRFLPKNTLNLTQEQSINLRKRATKASPTSKAVMGAIKAGCINRQEVIAMTGLTVNQVSACMYALRNKGYIVTGSTGILADAPHKMTDAGSEYMGCWDE